MISSFLQERIDSGDFPSAVYLVAEKGEIVLHEALGFAVLEPERIAASVDTIYDLASLTKVLVTGLLTAKLADSKECDVDAILNSHPHEYFSLNRLTARSLLTHTTGLPPWKPFYLLTTDPAARSEVIGRLAVEPPARDVVYSDLNFLLLEELLLERVGCSLDRAARREIFEPLGLRNTLFNPGAALRDDIAANERGNEFERQMCIEQGYLSSEPQPTDSNSGSDVFRDYQIWGEVHDGNAYFMGGVAGHAGLFSTATEVCKIALQFLPNYTTLLKPETCELFRTNFTPGMSEARSFGFQLASTKDSSAGTKMSPESFGHNGFTGTSLWVDPTKDRIFVLLTNRTHHRALPFANINAVRRRFHELAIDFLDGNI
ncbi:MAG TPA: serine hydrolase [Pyrinomonadaceae bacterium]|nr:serine hydrolase [Pyrinomonadaceae bacterium]